MIIILNVFLIILLLLIAYWWANQGLFSSILHLLCVIAAGAIAFGLWEVVTVKFLLRGGKFDPYAWGVALLGLFSISLVVLRVIFDKTVRANVAMPDWANLTFGFLVGLGSAVLTLGTLVIGAGFMQSHQTIAGYTGYGVSRTSGQIEHLGGSIWIPVHEWTNHFYNLLSVGSLHPTFEGKPLLHVNPDVHRQMSLLRASYGSGKGMFSLMPDAARVTEVMIDEATNRHFVTVEFSALARDFGEQMTLSRSQVRMIARVSPGSLSKPAVVFPDAWQQETQNQPWARFRWDDPSHFATSVPGRDSARITFEFPAPPGVEGRYIQIRGTRYELPAPQRGQGIAIADPSQEQQPTQTIPIGEGNRIDDQITVTNDIRPLVISINRLSGSLRHNERYLVDGRGTFQRSDDRPARALQIHGIHEPAGTKAVQVDVSRGTPADIFGDVRARAGADSTIVLVDDRGNTYPPVGYIHNHRDGTTIMLEPARYLRTADQLPLLPTSGSDRLRLVFYVTQGANIAGLRYGDITVGSCNVPVQ